MKLKKNNNRDFFKKILINFNQSVSDNAIIIIII